MADEDPDFVTLLWMSNCSINNNEVPTEDNWTLPPSLIFNDKCVLRIKDEFIKHVTVDTDDQTLFGFIYATISVLAVFGNLMIIFLILAKKRMRTNRHVFVANLACQNLLLGFLLVPMVYIPSKTPSNWPFHHALCGIFNAIPAFNIYCSTITIALMTVERYYNVTTVRVLNTRPDAHAERRRMLTCIVIAGGTWFASAALATPFALTYHSEKLTFWKPFHISNDGGETVELVDYDHRRCTDNTDKSIIKFVRMCASILQATFLYIVPVVVICTFNTLLGRFLAANERAMSSHRPMLQTYREPRVVNSDDDVSTGPPIENTEMASSPRRTSTSPRHSRVTRLLVAMAASYAILWAPFTILSALFDLHLLETNERTRKVDNWCKLLSLCSACVNPFLYAFLNRNFQRELAEYWHCARNAIWRFRHPINQSSAAWIVPNNKNITQEVIITVNNGRTETHVLS